MRKLENLEPARVFYWFEEICNIPHGSGNTKAISDFLAGFAAERGLKYYQDELNNVVIFKEGSEGYSSAAPVILQGHMDMVCEKTAGSAHDFEKDPLDLYVEDGFVRAKDTTLGGDDGIFVAMALAILEDEHLPHPPIEAVFTVDEETGLTGAEGLDASVLHGRRMINLDSEDAGVLWVSSAGGISVKSEIPVKRVKAQGTAASLLIDGLNGGHSGAEIDKNRASAVMLMGRVLYSLAESFDIGLVSLYGGEKENAIPNSCRAELLIAPDQAEAAKTFLSDLEEDLRKEYAGSDEGITITLAAEKETEEEVLHPTSLSKVLFFLRNVPFGVQKMSGTVEGLVETSNNAGIVRLSKEAFTADCGVRSSVSSAKYDIADRIVFLTEFLGGECGLSGDYPAWEFREESPLRDLIIRVYKETTGKELKVSAVHAGLECGLFYGKMPDLDCVSMGPDILDIHTVNEHLDILSVEENYKLLKAVLKEMKE